MATALERLGAFARALGAEGLSLTCDLRDPSRPWKAIAWNDRVTIASVAAPSAIEAIALLLERLETDGAHR